jgi:hypothetical protein
MFENVWVGGSGGTGINIAPASGGNVTGLTFRDCQVLASAGYGILINSSAAAYIDIQGGAIAGNSLTGILVNTSVSDFSIIGCRIGTGYGYGGNGGYGISFQGSNTRGVVMGNALAGNTSGEQNGAMTGTFVNTNNI